MRNRSSSAFALMALAVCVAMEICDVHAQTSPDSGWQQEANSRLRAIYERGEFRVRRFGAEWLPDSSGYTIQERDPKTEKSVLATYDVRTGKRTEAKSPEGTRADHGGFSRQTVTAFWSFKIAISS